MAENSTLGEELLGEGARSISDSVAWSGIGRTKLYVAMAEGRLPFVQQGNRRLIPRTALRQLLAENLIEATSHA